MTIDENTPRSEKEILDQAKRRLDPPVASGDMGRTDEDLAGGGFTGEPVRGDAPLSEDSTIRRGHSDDILKKFTDLENENAQLRAAILPFARYTPDQWQEYMGRGQIPVRGHDIEEARRILGYTF